MGSNAGRLLYGIKISSRDYDRLCELDDFKYPDWNLSQEQEYIEKKRLEEIQKSVPVDPYNPYETEDYYLAIKQSNVSSANGGRGLGKSITTDPKWDEQLLAACEKYQLPPKEPSWYLIGHYV